MDIVDNTDIDVLQVWCSAEDSSLPYLRQIVRELCKNNYLEFSFSTESLVPDECPDGISFLPASECTIDCDHQISIVESLFHTHTQFDFYPKKIPEDEE
jgi:hypothetical protein